jgi:hypothetical protein
MKGPRGSLSSLYDEAAKIAQGRLEAVGEFLDDIARTDDLPSGGSLSNAQLIALLRHDKGFAEQMAEKAPFMRPEERARLKKTIDEMYPAELPPTVSQIPPNPWEA